MGEQNDLLTSMLAAATRSIKEITDKTEELEAREDLIGLEGTVLETVLHLGAIWLGLVLSQWGAHLAARTGTRLACGCGGKARWVERRAKTVLTLLGRVTYWRAYYHCASCHNGEGVGDRLWGLHQTRTSVALKHLLAYLSGTTVGFAVVARNVCRTLRWPENWLSGKQVQRLAEPIGSLLGAEESAQVAQWWERALRGVAQQESRPAVFPNTATTVANLPSKRLYLEMDGIFGRIRGSLGKGSDLWREVKVGAVFWAEPGRHLSTLSELLGHKRGEGETARVWVDRPQGAVHYVAGLIPAAEFGIRLYAAAVAHGMAQAAEVVILADGAPWIWKLADEHFPGAIQILDFHHARDWVDKVAAAVYGASSAKATAWTEAQIRDHLIPGDARGLGEAIAALPLIAPPQGQTKSLPEQAMEYFQNNAERMHYPAYRERGLEIGSGIIESSGRRVVGVRCKQPGMRWTEEGLCSIVTLRTTVLNDGYDAAVAALQKAA